MAEGFTVVTTMKNEAPFLLEWVAFHLALGFDHIVLCTNDCDDPTEKMARRLARMGVLRHHITQYNPGDSIQRVALRQVLDYPEVTGADWVYICDADEFLCSDVGNGTVQALAAQARPRCEVISIPWRRFGSSYRRRYTDGLVTEQFTLANPMPVETPEQPLPNAFAKSLFRGAIIPRCDRLGIHTPIPKHWLKRDFIRELPGGRRIVDMPTPMHVPADYRLAQINHYQLRSVDSFLVKAERGRVNHVAKPIGIEYWQRNEASEVPCNRIARMVPELRHWRAQLLADRRLATLHARAVRWHQDRIAELAKVPDMIQLRARIEAGFPDAERGAVA